MVNLNKAGVTTRAAKMFEEKERKGVITQANKEVNSSNIKPQERKGVTTQVNKKVNSSNIKPQVNQYMKISDFLNTEEGARCVVFLLVVLLLVVVGVITYLCTTASVAEYNRYMQNTYIHELTLKLYDTKTQEECVRDLGLISVTDLTIGQYITHDMKEEEQGKLLELISTDRLSYFDGVVYLDKDGDEYVPLKMNTKLSEITEQGYSDGQ